MVIKTNKLKAKHIIKYPKRRVEPIQLGGTTLENLKIVMKPYARRKVATKRKPAPIPKRHKLCEVGCSKGH